MKLKIIMPMNWLLSIILIFPFIGGSLAAYLAKYCPGKEYPMGYATPHNLKGNFFLKTNDKSPFGVNATKDFKPVCAEGYSVNSIGSTTISDTTSDDSVDSTTSNESTTTDSSASTSTGSTIGSFVKNIWS